MTLKAYQHKRKFDQTPEPSPSLPGKLGLGAHRPKKKLIFVVQKHHASRLHYDFRLEQDGVLRSWAVPKGPSMDPTIKRLAMQVEDHPLAYARFHGTIPPGNYGAGTVAIWDHGTYEPLLVKPDELKIRLHGKKLTGEFALVRMKGRPRQWLLIKHRDQTH